MGIGSIGDIFLRNDLNQVITVISYSTDNKTVNFQSLYICKLDNGQHMDINNKDTRLFVTKKYTIGYLVKGIKKLHIIWTHLLDQIKKARS